MKFFGFLFALALLPLGAAQAENGCPEGMTPNPTPTGTPGANQCMPIPGFYGSGGDNSAPSAPKPVWETRWGAIASDKVSGKTGVVGSSSSKREAEKGALAICKSKGGANCQVQISYHNQCGAMAWGGGSMATASAATLEEASKLAIGECTKAASGCEVYFSDCSYPERVR